MDRLRDEYGFPVAYSTLNDYLRVRGPRRERIGGMPRTG